MGFLTRCKRPFLFAFLLQFCNMLFSFFLKTFLILFEKQHLWDAEGKLSKESEITIEEVRDDFEQIKHIKNLENFVEDPLLLKDVSPETLYCFLEKQGYTILPLAQSKTLTGIHYKDGGGFKVNWGGDRILQYHPATGSHHNGAYYKISSGKTGKVRIDLHGNKI